jgi:DsbC/DsbD-like thiol-disulfide interchange protein
MLVAHPPKEPSAMRLAFSVALCLGVLPVHTAAAQGFAQDVARVSLIEGWRRGDGIHVAAIEILLEPGWHTYWRVPGASGIPPDFDWSGSINLASVAYEWPRPDAFDSAGSMTIGYHDRLVLPVILRATDPEAPIDLSLDIFFGVCDDICVPANASVTARLDPAERPEGRAGIESALAERAWTPERAGVEDVSCSIRTGESGHDLVATVTFRDALPSGQIAILESGRPDIWIGEARSETRGRTLTATAPLDQAGAVLDRGDIRVTILDGARAVDIRGCRNPR